MKTIKKYLISVELTQEELDALIDLKKKKPKPLEFDYSSEYHLIFIELELKGLAILLQNKRGFVAELTTLGKTFLEEHL